MTISQQELNDLREKKRGTLMAELTNADIYESELWNKLKQNNGGVEAEETMRRLRNSMENRKTTLLGLIDAYEQEQAATSRSRRNLADQDTSNKILENQIAEAKKELEILEQNRLNNQRLVELGDYEYDRYRSHKNILKIIVYGSLGVLIIVMAMKNIPFFPPAVGIVSILAIMFIVLLTIIGRLGSNFSRTNRNWDKFNFSSFKIGEKEGKKGDGDGFWNKLFSTTCDNISQGASNIADAARQARMKVTSEIVDSETFTGMANPITNSQVIEPSNINNYDKFTTLF